MSTRITNLIIIALFVLSLVVGALLWNRLPDLMASHWNAGDQVDGYMPKFWGVFLMPLMMLGMFALFSIIPAIDSLKANIAQFREIFNLFIVLIFLFLEYIWILTLRWNLGDTNFRMSAAMLPALGLLFIFIGYMLRKAKRNFFIGIRTPWTLSSDKVWDETHRLGSILFIISGLLALFGSLFGGSIAFLLILVPLTASAIILVVYSYLLYRGETGLK
jgi:uncharacterized membrane protein